MSRLADITHDAARSVVKTRSPERGSARRAGRRPAVALLGTCTLVLAMTTGCRSAEPVCQPQAATTVLAAGTDDRNCCTIFADNGCGVRFATTLVIAKLTGDEDLAVLPGAQSEIADNRQTSSPTSARPESSGDDAACPASEMPACVADDGLQVAVMSPADQGRWVEAFRGLSFIRDLRFLSPIDLKAQGGGLPGIFAAARRAQGGLLLTYSANRCGPNSERIVGTIYAVDSGRPLVQLQSYMQFLNEEGLECAVDEERGDHRDQDAIYQTAREFEGRCVNAVRELARRSPPVDTTVPHRWIPLYPYCWEALPRPEGRPSCPPPLPGRGPTVPDAVP